VRCRSRLGKKRETESRTKGKIDSSIEVEAEGDAEVRGCRCPVALLED